MPNHKDNFILWFRNIIEALYPNEDAGFSLLMLTFPLLERYLRSKSNTSPSDPLGDSFYNELVKLFTALRGNGFAKKFWQVYRNGILHQATLSQQNKKGIKMPNGWLSGEKRDIEIDSSDAFWVNPVEFAKHVMDAIDKDFSYFEAQNTAEHHPLAIAQTASDGSHGTSGHQKP